MNNLKEYITERLKLSNTPKYITKDTSYFDEINEKSIDIQLLKKGYSVDDVEKKYKYNKAGKAYIFWKAWVTSILYGPLPKNKLLEKINELQDVNANDKDYLQPTSYGTSFSKWNAEGRFESKGLKTGIIGLKQKDWKI